MEFNSLRPNQLNQEPLAKHLRIVAGQDNDGGSLTVAVPAARQRIVDLPTWLEAWTIFAAALVHAAPALAARLLAYQGLILGAAQRFMFSAVLKYDRAFRQLIAADPSVQWDRWDANLYAKAFTGQGLLSARAPTTRPPFRQSGGAQPSTGAPDRHKQLHFQASDGRPICRKFNAKGCDLRACKYAHCCLVCQGPHSASSNRCGAATSQ